VLHRTVFREGRVWHTVQCLMMGKITFVRTKPKGRMGFIYKNLIDYAEHFNNFYSIYSILLVFFFLIFFFRLVPVFPGVRARELC
jgi:hypothetical protein